MSFSSNGTYRISYLGRFLRFLRICKWTFLIFISKVRRKKFINNLYYERLWTSIETMPIWYWKEIIDTGDLTYLFRNGEGVFSTKLADVWMELQEQHIKEFGIDELLRQRIKTMIKLMKLNLQYIRTRDRVLLNFIEMAEKQLEGSKEAYTMRFYKVLDIVSSSKGFRIDPKVFPTVEWYYALKNMNSHAKSD